MGNNTLKRSEYWDHDLYIPRIGATGNVQSHTDVQHYLLPMDQARNTACLTWGVAAGLAVQVSGDPVGLRISPGAAVDAEGRLIVLRPGGAAVVDPAADPDQLDDILTAGVADDGVVFGTAKVSGDRLLTVTWLEVLQQESPEDPPVLVHAPWLRLIPAGDDDGRQVVLARLTLDDGRVTTLSAGTRRLVGVPTGRLELRAVTETGGADLQVGQRVMAEFAADPEGDVVLTLTSDDNPRRSLSVEGATGNVSVHSTLLARGDADVTGKLTARATVEATGDMNVHRALNVLDTLNAHGALNALGAVNVQGTLTAKGAVTVGAGLNVSGGVLDVGRRMRVRQGEEPSAGIWFYQRVPNADRALIGMADDTTVGIWGNTGANWALRIDTTTGETSFTGSQVSVAGRLDVKGVLNAQNTVEAQGVLNAHGALNALGALNAQGPLTAQNILNANAGLNVRGGLDVYRRMRARQSGDASAGIWFHQDGPNADRAMIGMADDSTVGIWGNTGANWALRINTTTGEAGFTGSQVSVMGRLDVKGVLNAQNTIEAQGVLNAHGALNALGALNVQGILTANGAVTAGAGLTVKGVLTAQNTVEAQGVLNARSTLNAFGALNVVGPLSAQSNVTAGAGLIAMGVLTAQNTVEAQGVLNARSTLNAFGALNVVGPLSAQSNVTAGAGLDVRAGLDIRVPRAYYECDNFDVFGKMYVGGDVSLHGSQVYVHNNFRVVRFSSLEGGCSIYGSLSKPGGTFLIDHPLDPAGKYLSHSFVESPEMLNVYSGVAVTDDQGKVTVALPDYFEALNRDHRFQVTPIGRLAMAAVDGGVRDNAFTIRTDQPNVTVSWQVTGVRQDPWALAHPVEVEKEKPAEERGMLLYPEEHGFPATMGIRSRGEAERERKKS
ncbi:hypothetical protein ACFFV7_36195 [Nonomuraea spiralis]|uniref:Uncharacterized protein n=1 Tax=Nonomuraea spiralis TaxID=46182 RepID=A0ABV5IQ89_9ACTN|nr:hypothetical protein [Nonomuraea spiralis]GGT11723.1 hypothetical protein GCM10010176_065540 [Nonomuraea spiralis]